MKKLIVLLFIALPLILLCESRNDYKISIGENIYYSSFATVTTDSLIHYIYKHESELHVNYYTHNGITQKFTYQDSSKNIDIEATMKGKNIILTGRSGDQVVDKILEIDEAPWKQSSSYSLAKFALSDEDKMEYWIIRLDKFSAAKIRAVKKEIEDITIGEKQFPARKIKISATGILSKLWHGYYWFRASDGLFLKYKGLNGLPGSSKTVIELIDKE